MQRATPRFVHSSYNLTKALDTISGEELWQLFSKFWCREKFTKMVRLLHDLTLERVSLDGTFSDQFAIVNGIKQGCILGQSYFVSSMRKCLPRLREN